MNYPYSYYKSQADSLHKRFVESLKLLKDVSAPEAIQMCLDDLQDIYDGALELRAYDALHPLDDIRLKHILDRDVAQHVAIVRNTQTLITDDRQAKRIPS